MPVTLIDPAGLPSVGVYRHVAVATGSAQIHVAGQVAWDAEGVTVGPGDLATQVEQAYLNVATALAGVGASVSDLVRLTVYVVDWAPEKMPALLEGIGRASTRLGVEILAPATLIGVAALHAPEHLVEVEATAVADDLRRD